MQTSHGKERGGGMGWDGMGVHIGKWRAATAERAVRASA